MRSYHIIISSFLLILFYTSCSPTIVVKHDGNCCTAQVTKPTSIEQNRRYIHDISLNGKVYSALWQQNSGEFRALCYQAFNLATNIVNNKTKETHNKPLAIITDVDETFLDNSPYAVTQSRSGNEFDLNTWLAWTSRGEAEAFPGALNFFNHAASKGITIFYITNRNENDKPGTVKNLKRLGFPFVDDEHVVTMKETSNKEARRKAVLDKYEVIMYMGDNLTDFSELFYKTSQNLRNRRTDELAEEFGKLFIVLPNSGYGDWESAVPGFNSKASTEEKDRTILNSLKGY